MSRSDSAAEVYRRHGQATAVGARRVVRAQPVPMRQYVQRAEWCYQPAAAALELVHLQRHAGDGGGMQELSHDEEGVTLPRRARHDV